MTKPLNASHYFRLRGISRALFLHRPELAGQIDNIALDIENSLRGPDPVAVPDGYLHELVEPGCEPRRIYSAFPDNPWSHWAKEHAERCRYTCTPLYATQRWEYVALLEQNDLPRWRAVRLPPGQPHGLARDGFGCSWLNPFLGTDFHLLAIVAVEVAP